MFSWMRLAIAGVMVAALAAATIAVTSFLKQKDLMLEQRDREIGNLKAEVGVLKIDKERLQQSNASLQADRDRKSEELTRVQVELGKLQVVDTASNRRLKELELKLNSRERLEQMERLRNSLHAERLLRVTNRSARCELENFFQTGGACKSGVWVKDGERLVPAAPVAQTPPSETQPAGARRAPQ
jgi:hypothetical protein